MKKKLLTLMVALLGMGGVNAQTASDSYLSIDKYATIDEAGIKGVLDGGTLYYYNKEEEALIISAYVGYQSSVNNGGGQAWITYTGSGSSTAEWSANSPFMGSDYYKMNNVRAAQVKDTQTYKYRVSNCTKVSMFGTLGGSNRDITMSVYEVVNGTPSETAFGTVSITVNQETIVSVTGMDASKIYEIAFTNNTSSGSRLYEIAFYTGEGGGESEKNTVISWKYDTTTTALDSEILGNNCSVTLKNSSTDAFGAESAQYTAKIADDMAPSKGLKFNKSTQYIELTLTSGEFKAGDKITICGYNEFMFCTEADKNSTIGDIATGEDKEKYNVGTFEIPKSFSTQSTIYIFRKNGTATGIAALLVEPSVIINVGDAGYCTYASEYALDFTNAVEGLEAYKAIDNGDNVSFEQVTGTVPAKTGLLIKADKGEYTIPVASGDVDDVKSALVGVFEDGGTAKAEDFILYQKEGVVGFYLVGDAKIELKKNTAYFPASSVAAAARISYIAVPGGDNDGTTSLKAVENKTTEDGKMYDLQGRQVTNPAKGLYIKNGKKYIVK